jgi:hypothetical protein
MTVDVLGRRSIVHCFLKLLNLAIDMDHRSPDGFSPVNRELHNLFYLSCMGVSC